jgi:hypothetical protein
MIQKFWATARSAAVIFGIGVLAGMSAPVWAHKAAPTRALVNDFVISSTDSETGVARAFFYNERTVIEFSDYPLYFSVVDDKGIEIPYTRDGKYARLKGHQTHFIASVDGKKVDFKADREEKAQPVAENKKPAPLAGVDFSYELSGDSNARPTQIFDDGKRTFMQFRSAQTPPAVFVQTAESHTVAEVKIEGQYAVYDGLAKEFTFVAGSDRAVARYTGQRQPVKASLEAKASSGAVPAVQSLARGEKLMASAGSGAGNVFVPNEGSAPASNIKATAVAANEASQHSRTVVAGHANNLTTPVVAVAAGTSELTKVSANSINPTIGAASVNAETREWRATRNDVNLRILITKMGSLQTPPYMLVWDLPKDYPIGAEDSYVGNFKDAVRHFVLGTEMTDTPAQPCFYSNNVVRIVRKTVLCDSTK